MLGRVLGGCVGAQQGDGAGGAPSGVKLSAEWGKVGDVSARASWQPSRQQACASHLAQPTALLPNFA